MEKITSVIICLFSFLTATSQTNGIVRDAVSGKPIPYVNIWIENGTIGTTADENGNYSINTTDGSKTVVFSAVGYETKKVKLPETRKLALTPVVYKLENVNVKREANKTATIGDYKIKNIKLTYGSHGTPWMMARKFTMTDSISQTPFLKELGLMTDCHNDSLMFRIRLFEISHDGSPGNDLTDKQILAFANKGRKNTVVDLTPYGVAFPEQGFFIAVEWLIVPQNVRYKHGKKVMEWSDYDPGVGAIPAEASHTWGYMSGKWKEFGKSTISDMKDYNGKFVELAMKLTLTN